MAVCPICGDQVINGRCRFCGMPYRNDEVMYHLNESSREHYHHASSSVKQKMRESVVPLGDKADPANRPVSRAQIQARQQQIRQEAMQKMTQTSPMVQRAMQTKETINLNGKNKKVSSKKTTYSSSSGKELSGKKKKNGSLLFWGLVMLFVLLANTESCAPAVRHLMYSLQL